MTARVLMVDDEPLILEGFKRQLRNKALVETAVGGQAGLELIRTAEPFAVVISDMRMPEMNGAAFLEKVRSISPDSVRMILSGQSEIEATIAAVNRGQIFRFLTKPCSTEDIEAAIRAGEEQYLLVTGQRELLERTLRGAVEVLTEILSLTNPLAQRRANRISRYARETAKVLGVTIDWQTDLACLLSQIGCVTLPEDILGRMQAGQPLSDDEQGIYQSHPGLAFKLLGGIPRLEGVAGIVKSQFETLDALAYTGDPASWEPRHAGVFLLRAAVEFESALSAGKDRQQGLKKILGIFSGLSAESKQSLETVRLERLLVERQSVKTSQLRAGMVLDEDLKSTKGMLLASKGQELTRPLVMRLQSLAEGAGIVEPFRVVIAE